MTIRRRFAALALAACVVGCATVPTAPPVQARAAAANERGLEQLRNGDAQAAVGSFEQALQGEQSIEREAGIARAWYNLSVAHQRLGRMDDADRALDAVLLDDIRDYPDDQLTAIAFRKAVLAMARNDTAGAATALDRTRALCDDRCSLVGPALNLQARLALADQRYEDALALLADAARRNKRMPVEAANTARLQAATLLALGRKIEAAEAAGLALAHDKSLGHAERIHQDLVLLARASSSPASRRAYLMRAGDVARARGDQAGARRIQALLDAEDPPPTATEGVP